MDDFKFAWHLDKKKKSPSQTESSHPPLLAGRKKTCPYTIYTSVHINMRI